MVKFQPSKLAMRVRFPLPAPSRGMPPRQLILPMKHFSCLVLMLQFSGFAPAFAGPAAKKSDCGPVIKALRSEIAARPSRVLIAVEDALTMNEQCACEIIKASIEATRADAKLVGQIVFTALQSAPGMSATIVECAVEAAPYAAEEIRSAMQQALGDKAVKTREDAAEAGDMAPAKEVEAGGKEAAPTGKATVESGKELVARATTMTEAAPSEWESDDWFGTFHVGVGGIYLTAPGSSWTRRCDPRDHCCGGTDLSPACLRP